MEKKQINRALNDSRLGMKQFKKLKLDAALCGSEHMEFLGRKIREKRTVILGKVASKWYVQELIADKGKLADNFVAYYQIRGEKITNLRKRGFQGDVRFKRIDDTDQRLIKDLSCGELFHIGANWAALRRKAPKTKLQARVMYGQSMENF